MTDAAQRLSSEDFAEWWNQTGERELRQLLYWQWDPIGVNNTFPWATDEYAGYAPQIVQALRRGVAQDEIDTMLNGMERDRMGLNRSSSDLRAVASKRILDWYDESQTRWAEFGPLRN